MFLQFCNACTAFVTSFQNFAQQSLSMDTIMVSMKTLFEELLNLTDSVMTSNIYFHSILSNTK